MSINLRFDPIVVREEPEDPRFAPTGYRVLIGNQEIAEAVVRLRCYGRLTFSPSVSLHAVNGDVLCGPADTLGWVTL